VANITADARRDRRGTEGLWLLVAGHLLRALLLLWRASWVARFRGGIVAALGVAAVAAFATYSPTDPSWNASAPGAPQNILGGFGATLADFGLQSLGLAAWPCALIMVASGFARAAARDPQAQRVPLRRKALLAFAGTLCLAGGLSALVPPAAWPLARGLGGLWGEAVLSLLAGLIALVKLSAARAVAGVVYGLAGLGLIAWAIGLSKNDFLQGAEWVHWVAQGGLKRQAEPEPRPRRQRAPRVRAREDDEEEGYEPAPDIDVPEQPPIPVATPKMAQPKPSTRESRENQRTFDFAADGFQLPELGMLAKPKPRAAQFDEASLRQNARLLENVLAEFGVKGQIDQIRPGPVVTLYELVPAPGVKSSRVIALADDIARSMSARSARVSVVQGRNAIGIELPNHKRETVYLRDMLSSAEFEKQSQSLPLALGETIGGEAYIADLSKMPHLLIAGTTGSGKSVGVNAMILSILYKLPPDQCRFIMIDPKMLELSVYDGIPHLLAPVVTDPKKAIVALKWTVREMEDRYRLMSKIGVRNITGYNEKAREALARGEHFERTVQTGFDDAGRPVYESEKIQPQPMPFLVVVIDEVADLMMVAGKDIEGAVQRLAQMARAAGIHLIMATQRPSVDVITGTIKANFPTRISFQVTSKIDARTILGEQGAEQLLGQGDMLYMMGGGRIIRLHGPFVSDGEVEAVAKALRAQGEPQYLEAVTAGGDEDEDGEGGGFGEGGSSGDDLYDQALAVVTRDRKASTSYVQRRLQIGYNRAASLIERMEREGVVSQANHAGKREVLVGPPP
jgi:S-DNA-T family DNA segregation ATPase FtsK/SpoIIIE